MPPSAPLEINFLTGSAHKVRGHNSLTGFIGSIFLLIYLEYWVNSLKNRSFENMDNLIKIELIKRTIFGSGSVNKIPEECALLNVKSLLFVVDKGLFNKKVFEKIKEHLVKAGIEPHIYPEITPEPSPELADQGARIAKEKGVDCVLALGGGSTMDVGKAISVLATNDGKAEDYIGLELVKKPGLPSIMVPTTAGTGSEVTFTAVFTMRDRKKKGGINSRYLYPTVAVLDPELTVGLPPYVTAYTGMDALTHAIESFTSLSANFLSELISLKAIELIGNNIRDACKNGNKLAVREEMMKGSYMAGLGLAMAGVGAVHALAYPLGALFDIPHGIANAVMLPYVVKYNITSNKERFSRVATAMGFDGNSPEKLPEYLFKLIRDLNLPSTLNDLEVPEDHVDKMAEAAILVERPIKNNPRELDIHSIKQIYLNAFEGL